MPETSAADRLAKVLETVRNATARIRPAPSGRLDATVVAYADQLADVSTIEVEGDDGRTHVLLSVPAARVAIWVDATVTPGSDGVWPASVVLSTPLHDRIRAHVADLAARPDQVIDLTDTTDVRYELTPVGRDAVRTAGHQTTTDRR